MNPNLILDIALPITLFCIMFSMGASLTLADFKLLLQAPRSVVSGIFSQMFLLPAIAFIVLFPFALPTEIFAGFMILALSPGGTTSNMFSYLAGGNLALSISLTAIVSIVTPFSLPLLAGWILASQLDPSQSIQLPFFATMIKLSLVGILPVFLGMLLRHFKHSFCDRYEFWLTRLPLLMLLLVIAGIIFNSWQDMPYFMEKTGVPAAILAAVALVSGYYFARALNQSEQDSRTIGIETSIQNGGTAILVTGTILQNPVMTIAPVMYGILMLIPVFVYLSWLKLFKPKYAL